MGQANPTFPPPLPLEGVDVSPPLGFGVGEGVAEALEEDLEDAGDLGGAEEDLGGSEAAAAAGVAAALELRLLEGLGLQRFVVPLFLLAIASC